LVAAVLWRFSSEVDAGSREETREAPGKRRVAKEECALTQAITSTDTSRNLLMVATGGVISGILTPLLPALIDHVVGLPSQLRISLIAVPFAVLVFILVAALQRQSAVGSDACAIITMVAFVCAVNAAIFIEGQSAGAAAVMRYLLAGLTGGLVGTAVMALGMGLLPGGSACGCRVVADADHGDARRYAAGARPCARSRPDLVSLSSLAGWRRRCGW
jgi:hypothetical protein